MGLKRMNAWVVKWTGIYDCQGDVDRVPALLDRVERENDAGAWDELGRRLVLEGANVFPASFAALPNLVRLATDSVRALELAGAILRLAGTNHGCDDVLANCAGAIADFRILADRHLQSRPDNYLMAFLDLLAAYGQYHWSAALEGFADDFYRVACPHCNVEVTVAIGVYGRYSAIRDWHQGDIDRRDLQPATPEQLSGVGLRMYETAFRDGQDQLADGLLYLFGRAECPCCASVFSLASEYTSANRPNV